MNSFTAVQAREAFSYDPISGVISRTKKSNGRCAVGPIIARDNGDGYGRVTFLGCRVYLHRLAWLLHYGDWPVCQVDHIDGDRTNNAIGNLRDVDYSANAQNLHGPKGNNKFLGVSWDSNRNKFAASISVGPRHAAKAIHLGRYKSAEQAHAAYLNAKAKYHPYAHIAIEGIK